MDDERIAAGPLNRPVTLDGVPDTEEGVAELRERVRAEHAAYMRKWANWHPGERSATNGGDRLTQDG